MEISLSRRFDIVTDRCPAPASWRTTGGPVQRNDVVGTDARET